MIVCYYPYTLTLGSPVVLTSAGGDPNSAETMDFIPGSAIRGAAARVLTDTASDFHRLILSGEVRYLNAYVLLGNQPLLAHARVAAPREVRPFTVPRLGRLLWRAE